MPAQPPRPPDPKLPDRTRLAQAFEPAEELLPGDGRFVDLAAARGERILGRCLEKLRDAPADRPKRLLFAGHRGIGKTTELLKLKQNLEQGPPKFTVAFFDVEETLDPQDLAFSDLLALIAAKVLEAFPAERNSILASVMDHLKDLVPDISFKDGQIGLGLFHSIIAIKTRPSAREKLREAIQKVTSTLLDGLHDHAKQITAEAGQRPGGAARFALIVDALDKVPRNRHQALFVEGSGQLMQIPFNVVFTVPMSLLYESGFAQTQESFGDIVPPLAAIALHDFARPEFDRPVGMEAMLDVIRARCNWAGVPFQTAFDEEETARYLCRMSGGHVRHLILFVRGALGELDRLPIGSAQARAGVRHYVNSLIRQIPDDYHEPLRKLDKPKKVIPRDPTHQDILFSNYALKYLNEHPWYEVNPAIREIPWFKPAGRRRPARPPARPRRSPRV